jgi:5,10-methylenetetrahydromethanopterin reductase
MPTLHAIPPALADTMQAYIEKARHFTPQGAQYLENHRGHLMFVKPEERRFVTPDLIRATTITGSEAEIKTAIAGFAAAGYSEVAIQIVPGQEHAIEDWGRIRRAFA